MEWLAGVWVALTAFFLVGEWGFFLIPVVAFLYIWYQVSSERGIGALVTIVLTGLFVQFVSKLSITGWVAENWRAGLWWLGAYLVMGLAYSVFRWVLHCKRKRDELRRLEQAYRAKHKVPPNLSDWTPKEKRDFLQYLEPQYSPTVGKGRHYNGDLAEIGVVPTFDQNTYTIGRWFWYWPWSLLGWLLNDLIREIYDAVARGLRGIMDSIARRIFGDHAAMRMTRDEQQSLEEAERAERDMR